VLKRLEAFDKRYLSSNEEFYIPRGVSVLLATLSNASERRIDTSAIKAGSTEAISVHVSDEWTMLRM